MAITLRTFLCVEFAGAALLALWTVAVFPRLGPKSLRSTLVVALSAFALLKLLPFGVSLTLPQGSFVALLGLVLPGLFLVFLFIGWTLRHFASELGGRSGGGPGHRAKAKLSGS
jgi:hypothetical protein